MEDHILDVKGLKCPLPLLKARKRIADICNGDVLQILTTDPAAREDFVAYCEATGNHFLTHQIAGDVHQIRLKKA